MVRKIIYTCLIGALVVVGGCQESADTEDVRIPVKVQNVALGEVEQSIFYNGDIKAEREVKVYSKVPDRIERYFVDDGDKVSKNAPIAKIAATPIEQAVRQAEAGVAAAEAQALNLKTEYQRAERLRSQDAMSQQQFDGVKAQYEAVMAQAKQAQAMLISAKSLSADATITAPISGIIAKRYLEAGDMAVPAIPVASVVQMDRVKITAEATEADLGRLAIGDPAKIIVRAYPDEIFKGRISKISPVMDPLTRMAAIEIIVANADHRLKPGMYAEIEVITGILENIIVIPRHCVIENTSLESINGRDRVIRNYFVYIVDDSSKAEQRKLDVLYVNHRLIAVTGGIKLGEELVIQGQKNLRNGSPVIIPLAGETL
ncbi:efflux RND transporter periplasmic adaptor subunit [bacterium]|nr:efflux RND transporter periplasmic adaptor subunit [bacterium]